MDRDLVLLYDGLCGFCDATVQFILKHDRRRTMQFAPLQGDFARALLERHPGLAAVDSVVLIERDHGSEERVSIRSEAVLGIADYLGGAWRVARLLKMVPRALRDAGYDLFARHRYRVFGRYDACPIPAPEIRARFIA